MSTKLRSGRSRKLKFEINVVPYIDVMLVLVVILMVAAPMTNPSVVELPNAGPSKQTPVDYLELTLKTNGGASLGKHSHGPSKMEKISSRADLIQRLQYLHTTEPDLPLLIAADKNIQYDEVVQMIAAAKKVGMNRVGLATN
jgi:biopolymer transport protein TolR